MVTSDNEVIMSILKMVDQKREENKTLTCKIMELKDDVNSKVEITQLVQQVLSNVFFCCTEDSKEVRETSTRIFQNIDKLLKDEKRFQLSHWELAVVPELTRFCVEANEWNPIDIEAMAKSSKIIVNVNFPKNINLGNIIGSQRTN